jgi:hypothetical protein
MSNISTLIKLADSFERDCFEDLEKVARIRKLPDGKYRVLSQKGKNLGTSESKADAVKRLREVEYFKRQEEQEADAKEREAENVIDLTGAIDFSYSAIMREMRQEASKEQVRYFLTLFKKEFDKAVKVRLQKPEKIALQNALVKFNKKHKVKCKKKLIKNAAVSELGDPSLVGRYLADIVKFTLNKLPLEKRGPAIEKLRSKFYSFNADEMSQKTLPPTAAIGQSITFVKHVLINQNPLYIREVLNNLASNL